MASALHFIVLLCGLWIGANVISAHHSGCHCSGWTRHGSRYFRFYNNQKDWADAERFCTLQGSNLASILTRDEGAFISKIVRTSAWVGGYDKVKDGVWLWSDGKKFDFHQWGKSPKEPNNSGGSEGCMEFKNTGVANDAPCRHRKYFVCAKDA